MGDQAPGGYFVGRPANFEDKQPDAADAHKKDDSAPAPAENHVQQGQDPTTPAGGQKKPGGFLGNLFSCFSGGRVAES